MTSLHTMAASNPVSTGSLSLDGIHLKVRLEREKLCLLVMIGVRADGRKELVALTDGYRESTESWADLLRDCRSRGMTAPVLAVGDGALGFWKALREVFPATRERRRWWHKQAKGHSPVRRIRLWLGDLRRTIIATLLAEGFS
jgi:transposase-like protein